MKNQLISVTALVCAVLALVTAVLALRKLDAVRSDYNYVLLMLQESEKDIPQEDVSILGGSAYKRVRLVNWAVTATVWTEGKGADVALTATPESYDEDVEVFFRVSMDGDVVAEVPCQWMGSEYMATASLSAANGYDFYFVVKNGDRKSMTLLPAEDSVQMAYCVNLADSLYGYANLMVDDWTEQGRMLTVTEGFVEVQTPLLTAEGTVPTIEQARLVLWLGDVEVASRPVQMEPGEADGVYVADLKELSFEIPEMDGDGELTLWTEAKLSNGKTMMVYAVSWIARDGQLYLVTG